jgi:hypothetical protein
MDDPSPKKHSIQYHNKVLGGVYVPKTVLRELTGDDSVPETCTITISVP